MAMAIRSNKDGAVTIIQRRLWLFLPLVLAAFLAVTGRADAGPIVDSATNCGAERLEQPFMRWADPAKYFLVPDGSFSGGAKGWRHTDAVVVAENQPHSTHADEGTAALRISTGGSATSPAVCVGIQHPTMRFFARNAGGLLDTLKVEVLFEDAQGRVLSLPIGVVLGTGGWSPSLPLPIVANLLPLLPDDRTAVAFRFTAQGLGDGAFVIDDVYVDPYGTG
jgi:hypothetical protein